MQLFEGTVKSSAEVIRLSLRRCFYAFSFSLCRFHSSNSFLPSSVSKKAKISGRNELARDSISFVGIVGLADAIRHHSSNRFSVFLLILV